MTSPLSILSMAYLLLLLHTTPLVWGEVEEVPTSPVPTTPAPTDSTTEEEEEQPQHLPVITSDASHDGEVTLGQSMSLTCSKAGNYFPKGDWQLGWFGAQDYDYDWTEGIDPERVTEHTRLNDDTQTMEISDMTLGDSGDYHCAWVHKWAHYWSEPISIKVCSPSCGEEEVETQACTTEHDRVCHFPLMTLTFPSEVNVEGDDVTMTCTSSLGDADRYMLYWAGETKDSRGSWSIQRSYTGEFTLAKASMDDEGWYYCMGGWRREGSSTTTAPTTESTSMSTTAASTTEEPSPSQQVDYEWGWDFEWEASQKMELKLAPRTPRLFSIEKISPVVTSGTTFTLTCKTETQCQGYKVYHILKDGALLARWSDPTFRLVNVKVTDSGLYTCQVEMSDVMSRVSNSLAVTVEEEE